MDINKIGKIMSAVCTIGLGIAEIIIGSGKLKDELVEKTKENKEES